MNNSEDIIILAIESSCDDTSCAVLKNDTVLSNITAGQAIHQQYGGVVPELASRDHQKNLIPVLDAALKKANIQLNRVSAIAFTRGPGLMGSLLVGTSVAKSLALGLNIPLIEVNHMQGHILAHFIKEQNEEQKAVPSFPFLCLTVSGGHTQIVKVNEALDFELLAETEDDAVGEAFDKAAKILGLPYPGGPLIDRYAQTGNPDRFPFPMPQAQHHNYSFSGIKTAFLYFIQNHSKTDPEFIANHLSDICASYQKHLIQYLLKNLKQVAKETGIKDIAIAGGVSANSELRQRISETGKNNNWRVFIPKFEYCTDNAAMIGITAYFKFQSKAFSTLNVTPLARLSVGN